MCPRTFSFPNICLLMYIVASLQSLFPLGPYVIVFFGLWVLSCYFQDSSKINRVLSQPKYKLVFLFAIFYFLSLLQSTSLVSTINNILAFLEVLSAIIIYDVISSDDNYKFYRILVILYTILCMINCYVAYNILEITGINNLRSGGEDFSDFYFLKVSFYIVSGMLFIAPFLLHISFDKTNGVSYAIRFLTFFLAVVFFWFIFRVQFVTSIILTLLLLALFFSGNNKKRTIIIVLLGWVIVSFLPVLIAWLDSWENNGAIVYRLNEIQSALLGNSVNATDMNLRDDLRQNSINTFLENPIFGVTWKSVAQGLDVVGNHASWTDFLARYGIFSFLIFFFLYKQLKVNFIENGIWEIPLIFLILGFLNPLWFSHVMTAVFLYIPICYKLVRKKYENV